VDNFVNNYLRSMLRSPYKCHTHSVYLSYQPQGAKMDEQFQQWIDLYNEGAIDASQLVSELEFDGFDGDIIDFL